MTKKKSPTLFKFFTQLFITRIVPTTLTKSYRVSLFIFAQNQVSQKYLRMISFEHANLFPVLNRAAIENSKFIQMFRKKNNFESNWTIISNLDASKTKLGKPINSSSSEKGGQPNKKMSAKWKGFTTTSQDYEFRVTKLSFSVKKAAYLSDKWLKLLLILKSVIRKEKGNE